MKTLLTAVAIVALASTAMALPCSPLELEIVNGTESFIVNPTIDTIGIIGYQITSAAGLLNPEGFVGIGETFNSDPMTWGPILGWGAGGMGKANPTEHCLAELTTGAPVTIPAGFALSIGNACPNGNGMDIDFIYVDDTTATIFAPVYPEPEPATMSLLALGGLAVARRRRR